MHMNVLIVGANGFLGRNLIQKCLFKNWNVTCVYHSQHDHIPPICKRYSYNQIDKIKSKYDTVFLIAAVIPYGNFDRPTQQLFQANIKLPLLVATKFSESKVVFSSSCSVYGVHGTEVSEFSSFNNPSLYGLTKISAESIVRFHQNYQIVRYPSLYGQGMNQTTFLPTIVREAKKLKRITLFGNGSRFQNYLHVHDAVEYLLAAAARTESGVYLGVDYKSYSNVEVAKIVKRYVPDCSIRLVGKDESPSYRYNNTLSQKLLKYKPCILLENGIQDVMNYE